MLRVQHHAQAEERNDKDSARSEVLAPKGLGGGPAPPGNQGGGLEEGRDEKELSEFIIDCESHHPLSGP